MQGLDTSHNPEFTTCEFYRAYTGLEQLIAMTEELFSGLAGHLHRIIESRIITVAPPAIDFKAPFNRLDFIPAIERAIEQPLPNLKDPDASKKVSNLLAHRGISHPDHATLPQMLDRLSTTYLDPQCITPTFIINHPECLSPLAKSFEHPTTGQLVAARAELFVESREIVNTYEEENSPVEQRKKFLEQLVYRAPSKVVDETIDENYLEALEWGLPPTGGWGGGIERICMLFARTNRIGDVLSFGTLKNVVARRQRH